MDHSLRSTVERQVRRVRRRLLARALLHGLVLCVSAALALVALWFLARPLLFGGSGETWRWAVPGVLLGAGTSAGLWLGWLRTPSLVASALALDEQFALNERVTTLVTLKPELVESPAGQALLQDVAPRLEKLHVASGFPLLPAWHLNLLPLGALLLAVLARFLDPVLARWQFTTLAAASANEPKVKTEEVQQQLDKLRKVANENKKPEAEKTKEMKELLDEWEKLVNKPVDANNAEQVREHVAEMRNLEQRMKERAHELKANAQKNDALKRMLDKLNDNGQKLKEGPAKDFEDAVMKGDFHKAKEALDKLAKQLQNRQLTPAQQKELAEQFKQLQEKIQRVLEKDEKVKQLKKDFAEGRLNKEQLDRELAKMGAKDLQELANLLGECKECLGQEPGEAADALAKMAKQFEQADLSEQELDEILRNMEALNEAALGLGDALGDENGMGEGGPPGGRRPIDPNDPDSKIINQRQRAKVNPNSQQRITGFTTGGNFNKIPAKQLDGTFKQARQQAGEAIERQNIPEDAAGIARGYFQKLGGQK